MKTIKYSGKEEIRINSFIRDNGIASRRETDRIIESGRVFVNKKVAKLGMKIKNGDEVSIKGNEKKLIYALYHKKRGEITGKVEGLGDALPVGRLDKESEGLLIYTNDFRIIDKLLNPIHKREKEYEVNIREKATPRVINILKKGIRTREAVYNPVSSVSIYNEGRSVRIILTEGKKHEIRRMLNALNLTIERLVRVRIMSFHLRGIASGKFHIMSEKQKETLLKDCKII